MYPQFRYFGLISLIVFLFSIGVKAEDLTHNWLGQKDIDNFHLRSFPDIYHDQYNGILFFNEEKLVNDSFDSSYLEINQLDTFLNKTLSSALQCSPEILKEHTEYIRYSYRLIVLSLLYESLEENNRILKKFNIRNSCEVDWKKYLEKNCKPRSREMKFFINNTSELSGSKSRIRLTKSRSEFDRIWKDEKEEIQFSLNRYSISCKSNCDIKYYTELDKKMENICDEDLRLFSKVCSELDDLYGITNSDIPYNLILNSNIINVFNSTGQAAGCLRSFSEMNQFKENREPQLRNFLSMVSEFVNQKYKGSLDQGQIFFNGAQKEFRLKGLKNVLVANKKKKTTLKKEVQIQEEPEEEDDDEPILVKVEKNEVAKKPEPQKIKKEVIKPVVITESAFVMAQNLFTKTKASKVDVDMIKFKYDKIFSFNRIKELDEKLSTLMTVKALSEMKKYDKLGKQKSPVPLTFIKFLIDTEKHKNLYNLITIVGESFFALNDLEVKPKKPVEYIMLKNDLSTNYRWQISIVTPVSKKSE